jgi:hypothetical protein
VGSARQLHASLVLKGHESRTPVPHSPRTTRSELIKDVPTCCWGGGCGTGRGSRGNKDLPCAVGYAPESTECVTCETQPSQATHRLTLTGPGRVGPADLQTVFECSIQNTASGPRGRPVSDIRHTSYSCMDQAAWYRYGPPVVPWVVHRILLMCDSRDLAVRPCSLVDRSARGQHHTGNPGSIDKRLLLCMYVAQRPWRPGRRAVAGPRVSLTLLETLGCDGRHCGTGLWLAVSTMSSEY